MTDARKPHRTAVYLRLEDPSVSVARHSASRSLARLAVNAMAAKVVPGRLDAIQITTSESWREVKLRVRPSIYRRVEIPKLLAPGPDGPLLLNYPPRGYESDAARRQREVWMKATRF